MSSASGRRRKVSVCREVAGQHHLPLHGVLQAGGQRGGVQCCGHHWEGHLWVPAAGGGKGHRQLVRYDGDKQGVHSQEVAGEAHGAGELNNGSCQLPLPCQARVTFPDQNQPLSGDGASYGGE